MKINHDANALNDCFLFTWSAMQQFKGGAIPKNRRNTQISKNVLLLKKNDFHNVNGGTCMPTQSEMSTIKRSDHLKQFKRNLEFDADKPFTLHPSFDIHFFRTKRMNLE